MYSGQTVSVTLIDIDQPAAATTAPLNIAELVLDAQGASVNVLNSQLQDELIEAVQLLEQSNELGGLLIRSAKPAFVLGADITEFTSVFDLTADDIAGWAGKVQGLFSAIEALPFPTVSLVNGMALGGGMELALSTDFRIADDAAKLGLPEVTLGICPGWGGTVRLNRLIGAEAGLGWMLSGKPVKAAVALKQGAIDAVASADQMQAVGLDMLQRAIAGELDFKANRAAKQQPMANTTETKETLAALEASFSKGLDPRYPAAPAILASVVEGMTLPFEDAIQAEAKVFAALASGSEAKSLVGLFQNDQHLKRVTKKWSKQAAPVQQSAVLGAGIMGGGIAYQSALSGVPILMKDINQDALDLGISTASSILDRAIKKGRMTEEGKEQVLANIHPELSYDQFGDRDYVIEAVVERIDIKQSVLAEVEQKVPEQAVLASNTSTISIDSLAEGLQRPEQFCGMHFFNPVQAMKLVEVIRGSKTSDATVAATVAYAAALGKTPIVVQDCPGFLVNRVLFPYFNGFNRLLMDGVDFERIDQVMETFGWPMGPAYLADVIGLDTMVHADKVLEEGFPERMGHDDRPIIETLLEQGSLGQKNGQGFYEYGKDESGKRFKRRSERVGQILEQRVSRQIEISDDQIIARMMIPMCMETVRCLEEGIVDSAAEADMGLILGLGFPRFRGGALRYIDTLGTQIFVDQVLSNKASGPLYTLTEGMVEAAKSGNTFY